MTTYYRISAHNRTDLSSESRATDEVTVLHYDATPDRRVKSGKFVEEKNSIPSLTFDIYSDNPGYNRLTEFDTLITLEEMYDAFATGYLGDSPVEMELIEGTEDEYRLRFLNWSEASTDPLEDEDEYRLVIPLYVSVAAYTEASGIIVEGDYVLVFAHVGTEVTMPLTRYLFEGRVIKNVIYLDSSGLQYRSITCEGMLGYLCDSMQPYLEERTWEDTTESSGLYKYMQHLLDVHNAQVEEHKRIYIGACDTTTNITNEQVTKGTNWDTTWNIIQDKLIDVFGGEIRIDRGTDGLLYLFYTDKLSQLNVVTKPTQPIRLGLNIVSGSNDPEVDQVITRLYPLGAKLDDSEERLTIEGATASGGLAYIEDAAMKRIYGIVPAVQEWDDVTIADNLHSKAVAWLAENNNYPVSLTLKAYDLSLLGYDFERLELYSDVVVDAEPLETASLVNNGTLEIVKRSLSLESPWLSTLTFGDTTKTASARYAGLNSALKGTAE